VMDRETVGRGMLLAGLRLRPPRPRLQHRRQLRLLPFYDAAFPAASSSQEEVQQPRSLSCKAIFRLARRLHGGVRAQHVRRGGQQNPRKSSPRRHAC
jgi:hypothetical protein